MSVATVTSSTASSIVTLVSAAAAPVSSSDSASSNSATVWAGDGRGLATNVQLSDNVKAILVQAETNQSVAEKLQAFVQSQRAGGGENTQGGAGSKSTTDVDTEFQRLTGGNAQAANSPPAAGPVEPTINFSNQAQIAGFSVSVTANAATGAFSTVITGPDGLSFFDKRFGQNGEASGSGGVTPGASISENQAGNVEYVTFSEGASASTSTTTSSSAGSSSISLTAAQASTTTIAIDFTTGQISVAQAAVARFTAAAQIEQPAPSFSTVA